MPPEHVWQPTATPPVLHPAAVHVWWATLAPPTAHRTALAALLSPDEQQRAARFVFPQHQQHFTVARGLLRLLIGRYLSTSPAALRFTYSSHGKPALLQTDPALPDLRFNVSHSHGQALYAFSLGREVGIDLEQIRPDVAYLELAERFFAPAEAAALHRLPTSQQRTAFFVGWTRKEAYIKARGAGLALSLKQFVVSLTPAAPARLLATHDDPAEHTRWTLADLPPIPGYAAALAAAGNDWHSSCFVLPETSLEILRV